MAVEVVMLLLVRMGKMLILNVWRVSYIHSCRKSKKEKYGGLIYNLYLVNDDKENLWW